MCRLYLIRMPQHTYHVTCQRKYVMTCQRKYVMTCHAYVMNRVGGNALQR